MKQGVFEVKQFAGVIGLEDRTIYIQQQKCRPMTLVFGNIRYMRIIAGVTLGGGLK